MRAFLIAVAIGVVCLAAAATAQSPPPSVKSQDVFKSVTVLKDIPVDTFFESMGMFASAMGNDCTFCHVKEAYFDRAKFAVSTPKIVRARGMILMMNAINNGNFRGDQRVTCFTCHRGNNIPVREPDLAIQYGVTPEDPNVIDFPEYTQVTAESLFDKYLTAIGGRQRVAALTSLVGKGIYEGFDTAFAKIPVEVYAKAPNLRTMVVKMGGGESYRVFDGRSGWMAGPDTPVPILELTGGNLERARLEALVAFPANIRQTFSKWKVGRTAIEDKEVFIVQGGDEGQALTNFYFDQSGMLVRLVRWTVTPVGRIPTQVDYKDYRDVNGVKVPFQWTVSQTYMQMTVTLDSVQANAAIDAAKFNKPAPGKSDR